MKLRSFSLRPFSPADGCSRFDIKGSARKESDKLRMTCLICGPLAELVIPEPAGAGVRRKDLWRETCLELFLASRNSRRYWEFNLSPSGDWNVYRFSSYRRGMREEAAFVLLPFCVLRTADALRVDLTFDPGVLVPGDGTMRIGVSTVLKHADGGTTFWALVHPGSQPDFHRREGFVVEL